MRRILQATLLVAAIAAVAGLSACASGGGSGARADKCLMTPGDTIYRVVGMIYRPCAVDHQARLTSSPKPTFTPNAAGGQSCYIAEFEFIVDEAGKPIVRTVRTLRANDRAFESSMAQLIPGLVYEPAVKDGTPVKQVTTFKQSVAVATVVVAAGAPVRRPTARPPAC
jgi:hypothetical protein